MSLTSAIHIANSALNTSQIGLQIASQNLANAATPGYTRNVAILQAVRGRISDPNLIGSGVAIQEVRRQIDQSLQNRLWNANSGEYAAAQRLNVFDQLETALNEGTEYDLSSNLAGFFNVWSEATTLLDSSSTLRNQAQTVTTFIRNLREDLLDQRQQIEEQIDAQARQANALLSEIASINETITTREAGSGQDGSLRDRRDQLVTELAQIMDVRVNENNQGSYDLYVGSTPVVQGTKSRGITVERETVNGTLTARVAVADNLDTIDVENGSLGGLLSTRSGAIDETLVKLDEIAANLIFETNKLHSTGINEDWLTSTSGTLQIASGNLALPLNDPANNDLADLPFSPVNGGFNVHIRNEDTGTSQQVFIPVDLDGIDTLNVPSVADDTSAEDIRAALNAIPGLNASFDATGRLEIDADTGFSFAFSDDSSGVLATLGVNSFLTGTGAGDIGVREGTEVMLGRLSADGTFEANGTAKLIGELGSQAVDALGGRSINSTWLIHAQEIAVGSSATRTEAQASMLVRENLDSQRAAVSGVSIDEESINMLSYQRQYQGAAQIITAAQEMFDTLISLV